MRWTTRDPLGEAGGGNLYAFVGKNPVNWVDPWGLAQVCDYLYKTSDAWQACYDKLAPVAVLMGVEKALLEIGVEGVVPSKGDDLKANLPSGAFAKINDSPKITVEEVETISAKAAWRVRLGDGWELKIYLTYGGDYQAAVGYDTNSLAHFIDALKYLAKEYGITRSFPNSYNAEQYGGFWVVDDGSKWCH